MTKITKKFPAGSYVFYAAQDKYPLISQALEPEAQRAFFGKDVKDPLSDHRQGTAVLPLCEG